MAFDFSASSYRKTGKASGSRPRLLLAFLIDRFPAIKLHCPHDRSLRQPATLSTKHSPTCQFFVPTPTGDCRGNLSVYQGWQENTTVLRVFVRLARAWGFPRPDPKGRTRSDEGQLGSRGHFCLELGANSRGSNVQEGTLRSGWQLPCDFAGWGIRFDRKGHSCGAKLHDLPVGPPVPERFKLIMR